MTNCKRKQLAWYNGSKPSSTQAVAETYNQTKHPHPSTTGCGFLVRTAAFYNQ